MDSLAAQNDPGESEPTGLGEILTTEQLYSRPSRPPNHVAENRALIRLVDAMARSSNMILQQAADTALELTGADSAGISVLDTEQGADVFRWRATAGTYLPFGGATMPRAFSPCGVVLDRNATQLMSDPVRVWPYIADLPNRISEVLLVPFYRDEIPVGTVWVVSHRIDKLFDAEDARIVGSICKFAAAAVETLAGLEALDLLNHSLKAEAGRRRCAEIAASEARDKAETANREKDRFLAILSHELRTPLTPALLTATAMAEDESIPASIREDARLIQRNIESETRLIDDLLDVNRLASGKVELKRDVISVHDVLAKCIAMCAAIAARKGVHLETDFAAHRRDVAGDAGRLRQVFSNLLTNAVKFTPAGGQITVATVQRNDSVEIVVRDTGMGIHPARLARIFDAFEQGDRSITQRFEGMGLGLAIAKGFVEAHGGTITAESAGAGRGTTLRVSLPCINSTLSVASEPEPRGEAEGVADMHILLVEDHEDSLKAMSRLLRNLKYRVHTASTMNEALVAFDRMPFDLLISDVGLPDGSGLDLMRQIRAKRDIDGIALTGYGTSQDVWQTLDAGFALHLTKPIQFRELQIAVGKLAAKKSKR